MNTLAAAIVLLAAVGVVCAVVNIAYNPEEYEYEDMKKDDAGEEGTAWRDSITSR